MDAHILLGKIAFHANDWFDICFFAGTVELDNAKHRAVVCDRQRFHVEFFGAGHDLIDLAQAIKQAKFGMNM